MSYNDFCSIGFINTHSNSFIFNIIENLTHPSCNLNFSLANDNKYVKLFGDHYINGNMALTGKIHLDILNPKIINELQIEIFGEISEKEIKVPSIFTFEEAKPKSLKVIIPKYLPKVELNFPESSQFLKGACMNTTNDIPYPHNRDFRIRSICSNIDGIYGMKMKSLIQNYNPNQFCVYETSIDKCIFNDNLENYRPIKYSEVLPLFEKDKTNPSIFFFDSPNDHYFLSLQYASMINYDKVTIVNNDNAKLTILVPSNFDIYANGHYTASVFYYLFDFNAEENAFNYGSLYFKETEILYISPISLNHNNIVFKERIPLNGYDDNFSLNANQNHYMMCSINYNKKINMKYNSIKYDAFSFDNINDVFLSKYKIIRLLKSEKLKINDLNNNKYIIQSTIGNTITFDMSGEDKNADKSQVFLFIKEVKINFIKVEEIDFKDYNIFFYKCILDDQWVDKIKGNNLLFDSESYNSFYSKPNKLKIFNGDKIQVSQNYITLRSNRYHMKNINLIELNLYNTFYDNIGKEIKFIGNVSTLTIGCVQNKTHLSFNNFSKLTIISEKINRFISLSNVSNLIVQLDSKNEKNYINSIEIFENYQTKLKSNGKIIVENLILNCNYDAFSIYRIEKVEIVEETNILLKNGVIIDSIVINNNSSLTLDSCSSESKKIKVYIHNILEYYPKLNLKNNNSIDIDVIEIMLDDENLESEIDLIKGIQQEKCKHLKKNKKINVFNSSSHDITKNYGIKCKSETLYLCHKSDQKWIIIVLPIIAGILIFIMIVLIIIYYNRKKEKIRKQENSMLSLLIEDNIQNVINDPINDNQTENEECLSNYEANK